MRRFKREEVLNILKNEKNGPYKVRVAYICEEINIPKKILNKWLLGIVVRSIKNNLRSDADPQVYKWAKDFLSGVGMTEAECYFYSEIFQNTRKCDILLDKKGYDEESRRAWTFDAAIFYCRNFKSSGGKTRASCVCESAINASNWNESKRQVADLIAILEDQK